MLRLSNRFREKKKIEINHVFGDQKIIYSSRNRIRVIPRFRHEFSSTHQRSALRSRIQNILRILGPRANGSADRTSSRRTRNERATVTAQRAAVGAVATSISGRTRMRMSRGAAAAAAAASL